MRHFHIRAIFLAMMLFGGGIGLLLTATQQARAGVTHNSIAVESPRTDTPIVLDGTVYSSIQLHDRVIVGGEFTRVQTVRNGPIVDRVNIFAYDINTGEIIEDFTPTLDGRVRVLEASPDENAFYLGGTFKQIDGQFHLRLAKIGYDGSADSTFRPEVSAEVHSLELHEGTVYVGGAFDFVNNEVHNRIGAVHTTTGASIDGFDLAIVGELGKQNTRSVRHLEVHPDGQRLLVVSNGQSIVDAVGTHDRFGVGLVNLDTFRVTPWRTQWFEFSFERCSSQSLQIRDASFSPDGSQFAVVEKGNFNCDKIVSFDTVDDGTNNPKWVTAAHDSVFSVEITDQAVYAGGHFCFVTAHGAVASVDAPTYPWVRKPERCEINTFGEGNQTIGDFNARQQIVALALEDGEVLDWNPRSNAREAVWDITSIDRGLLIGQDSNEFNTVETGRQIFLDFGGATPAFELPTQACIATVEGNGVQLDWAATNERTQLRRDGRWLATTTGDAIFHDADGTANSEYVLRIRTGGENVDFPCNDGNEQVVTPAPIPEPPAPAFGARECVASLDGDNVVLNWGDTGASSEVLRRNDRFLATVTDQETLTDAPGFGDHEYVLRLRLDGERIDVTCNPSPITIAEPAPVEQGPVVCTVLFGEDSARIEFTANTTGTHVIRRNDRWVATVNALTNFTDDRNNGDYLLRRNVDGVVTDIPCTDITPTPEPEPAPAPAPTPPEGDFPACTVTVTNQGATLNWIATDDRTQIRRDGLRLDFATGDSTYTDPDGTAANSYVLRIRVNGLENVVFPCTPA